MATDAVNPLLSTSRASDTSPTIQLHPLALLTISDSITRHTLRQQKGPVAGAILGQQNGQEITMEVAFQAKLVEKEGGEVVLDDQWFSKRLEDCKFSSFPSFSPEYPAKIYHLRGGSNTLTVKAVYKQPQLDLVGWFALGPQTGPQPHLLPTQNRISELTELPLLVLFHPSEALSEATTAGKLPLTIYEPVHESASGHNDKAMDIDGASQPKELKFRELVYSVETAEAEMIAVDFVAKGGGNATAVEDKSKAPKKTEDESKTRKGKGKQKAEPHTEEIDVTKVLTAEDDERRLIDHTVLSVRLTQNKYSPILRQRSTPSRC